MKEMRLPREFSFVRHTEATSDMGQEMGVPPQLTERGKGQAIRLGEIALLDKISGGTTVRLVTAPDRPSKNTAQIAYGGPMWIDGKLGVMDDMQREVLGQEYGADQMRRIATTALSAVARLQRNFHGEIHPVAVTTDAPMLALRGSTGVEDSVGNISAGDIDTYRLEDDGSMMLRTTHLGQNPQECEFVPIPVATSERDMP